MIGNAERHSWLNYPYLISQQGRIATSFYSKIAVRSEEYRFYSLICLKMDYGKYDAVDLKQNLPKNN